MEITIQSKKHGDKIVLIDAEDFLKIQDKTVYISKAGNNFYAMIWENKKNVPIHKIITGQFGNKNIVDHISGDTLDNRKSNLRKCSPAGNQRNRVLISKNNTSGFKGVIWHKQAKKWRAQIYVNSKPVYIGYYESKSEAAKAYNEKAIELFGEYARLNILEVLK